MNSTIPAEVLALKTRLDQWRATRNHIRERMPADLRRAVAGLCRRHSRTLIRRVLKIDPWRLQESMTTKGAATGGKQQPTFIELQPVPALAAPISMATTSPNFRLQLERSDGSRLTLTLPALDLVSARQICADFLRDDRR